MKHFEGFLQTPLLWKQEQFGLQQFELPSVDLTDITPKPIPTNLRLGHQIEYIFKQLLEESDRYSLIAHNIQIKQQKATIGELDFLVNDHVVPTSKESPSTKPQPIHIELTYKFYIIDPSISEPIHRLLGPNRKDMFHTKMEKTRDQQLPLLYTPEGRRALASYPITLEEVRQQTYFAAQLFTPFRAEPVSIRPLNPKCIVGYWLTFEQFQQNPFGKAQYYIPMKYEWLHLPHTEVPWTSHFDTLLEVNVRHINQRAPMLWVQQEDGTLEKCFVVWWS